MLTAHLPSGYVLARGWPRQGPVIMAAVLIGAVLPDLDMIWFSFVDHGSIHHHRYWVHIPAFWAVVAVIALPLLRMIGKFHVGLAFFAAIFLHLVLDSIGGGILWLAPFNDRLISLVTVPAMQSHWILSFILHWTFLLELLIWGAALVLWKWKRVS